MTEGRKPGADVAGAIGCVLAMGAGAAAVWAARDFSDLGAVFPRTVGALMVALGAVYITLLVRGRTRATAALGGSMARRGGVALAMLAWGFALEPLGFLASSAAAMAVLQVLAHHGRWTMRRTLAQAASTALVLAGFYALFKHALGVPLP